MSKAMLYNKNNLETIADMQILSWKTHWQLISH